MDTELIKAVITAAGSIIAALITVMIKNNYDEKKAKSAKEKEENIEASDIEEMIQVQEWLETFREKHQFDRASIYQFHNGGKYFQGKSMKKFSMTYEAVAPGYEKTKRDQQNVLASEYPRWISEMLKKDCFATLSEDLDLKDRHEMDRMGIQQFVTVPVYCIKKKLVGFIVGYNISEIHESIEEQFELLVEDSKIISGYLS
jgi:hypothetical protein